MWNWQIPQWPEFSWQASALEKAEAMFREQVGILNGTRLHFDQGEQEELVVQILSLTAEASSRIEGEILDRHSVQASIRRHLGLETVSRRCSPAEAGSAEMMVDLIRTQDQPLTREQMCRWNSLLLNGRRDLLDIGQFRTHQDPMQILSGPLRFETIHFEAPPSQRVAEEMQRFLIWFEKSRKMGLSSLIRAGIAHIWFVSIHPFEDGNGRIGRAVSEKCLAQDGGSWCQLSETIDLRKKEYYQNLHRASRTLDLTEWLLWFSAVIIESQRRTMALMNFVLEKAKFFRKYEKSFNPRQEKALKILFREGVSGFKGGLSARNYQSIVKASPATTTRDLRELTEMGALRRAGERKSTRYFLNIKTSPVERVDVDDLR